MSKGNDDDPLDNIWGDKDHQEYVSGLRNKLARALKLIRISRHSIRTVSRAKRLERELEAERAKNKELERTVAGLAADSVHLQGLLETVGHGELIKKLRDPESILAKHDAKVRAEENIDSLEWVLGGTGIAQRVRVEIERKIRRLKESKLEAES